MTQHRLRSDRRSHSPSSTRTGPVRGDPFRRRPDIDGLAALCAGLDPDDCRRRFFSAFRPSRPFLERIVTVAERGGFGLVATVSRDGGDDEVKVTAARKRRAPTFNGISAANDTSSGGLPHRRSPRTVTSPDREAQPRTFGPVEHSANGGSSNHEEPSDDPPTDAKAAELHHRPLHSGRDVDPRRDTSGARHGCVHA